MCALCPLTHSSFLVFLFWSRINIYLEKEGERKNCAVFGTIDALVTLWYCFAWYYPNIIFIIQVDTLPCLPFSLSLSRTLCGCLMSRVLSIYFHNSTYSIVCFLFDTKFLIHSVCLIVWQRNASEMRLIFRWHENRFTFIIVYVYVKFTLWI